MSPAAAAAAGVISNRISRTICGASVLHERGIMKRGFSLIEVLVVIAIIALLMAILMPILSRVREQATIVVVNSELYWIAVALESYFLDNENKYPPI